jgi:ParB family chromosome partitioning protein
MSRRVGDNLILNQFAEVSVHQELDRANEQIETLTAEIERLKRSGNKAAEEEKVLELQNSLSTQGILKLPIESIEPNPAQPRKTFNEESIVLLARSLEQDGQQQPILVFEKSAKQYFLFDGERRWRAAQKIDWETIDAIVVPVRQTQSLDNPESMRRQAMLANHHRENLNPLDLAEALIQEIALTYEIEEDAIPKRLDAAIARLTRRKAIDRLSILTALDKKEQEAGLTRLIEEETIKEEERGVIEFLLSMQLNPASVKANIFPALKLFDDLKDAIRSQGLGGHQAKILQQLSPKNLGVTDKQALKMRQQVTQVAIEKKLSVADTRAKVKEVLSNREGSEEDFALGVEARKAIALVEKIKIDKMEKADLEALETKLKEKLKQIRASLKR